MAEFYNTISNLAMIVPAIYGVLVSYRNGFEKRLVRVLLLAFLHTFLIMVWFSPHFSLRMYFILSLKALMFSLRYEWYEFIFYLTFSNCNIWFKNRIYVIRLLGNRYLKVKYFLVKCVNNFLIANDNYGGLRKKISTQYTIILYNISLNILIESANNDP